MADKLQKIGILGGSFDPVHNGHLSIAEDALEQMNLDKVFMIPTAQSPLKGFSPIASSHDRLKMLKLATEEKENIEVIDWEVNQKTVSYSYLTAIYLKKEHSNTLFYWIIGTDQLNYLSQWYQINELAKLIEFIVVDRPGYNFSKPSKVPKLKLNPIKNRIHNISSTEIREKLHNSQSVEALVPQKVYNYIKEQNLYHEH